MRWSTIYVTESMKDKAKSAIRIHDIGETANLKWEIVLGVLNFSDRNVLALVSDEHAIEVAKSLSKKLGLPIEGFHGDPDLIEQTSDRDEHNAFKQ